MSIIVAIPTKKGYRIYDTFENHVPRCTECGRIVALEDGEFEGTLAELLADIAASCDTLKIMHGEDLLPECEFAEFHEYQPEDLPICYECGSELEDGAVESMKCEYIHPALTAYERNMGLCF